jgi:hypothetical protein
MPEATRLAVQGQPDRLIGLYHSALPLSALSTMLVAGIGFVTAPEIAEIVLPDRPGTITTLLRILVVGCRPERVPGDLDVLDRVAVASRRRDDGPHAGLGPARRSVVDADRLLLEVPAPFRGESRCCCSSKAAAGRSSLVRMPR